MKFEESKYFDTLKTHKYTLPIGNFYFCEKFYLSEINEGMHLDFNVISDLMTELVNFYGRNKKIGFISNRINSYSLDPRIYNQIYEEFDMVVVGALVVYSDISYMNASIEKRFSKRKLKRCVELDEAIEWMLNRKELN